MTRQGIDTECQWGVIDKQASSSRLRATRGGSGLVRTRRFRGNMAAEWPRGARCGLAWPSVTASRQRASRGHSPGGARCAIHPRKWRHILGTPSGSRQAAHSMRASSLSVDRPWLASARQFCGSCLAATSPWEGAFAGAAGGRGLQRKHAGSSQQACNQSVSGQTLVR